MVKNSFLVVKNPPATGGDAGAVLIPESRKSPGGGIGNSRQHSCWETPVDRGAWQATVHGVTKSKAQRSTVSLIRI